MSSPIRLSVRSLVAFTCFPPDIMPYAAPLMEEGRVAHLMRQGLSGLRAEQALTWSGSLQGLPFVVSGRMDLFDPTASPPVIEEIKLCLNEPPDAPYPEHLLQAQCYGHMLCCQEGRAAVAIRISYASLEGELRASFEAVYTDQALSEAFFGLLRPYAVWQKRLIRHRAARDKSLEKLPFPYPAYRPGQHEMASQVYLAILRRRRLFAVMPTGTGKSAAVLYPALKALGLHHADQVFCLTARGTAGLAMEKELRRMRAQGLKLKALSLTAREKLCPMAEVRCDPAYCPRAAGHFVRQAEALPSAMRRPVWDMKTVLSLSDRHQLCPFELSLALASIADVVICDYNYVFDPRVRIKRIFEQPGKLSVLVDEAHNLPDRTREMLSGRLDAEKLALWRRSVYRGFGRTQPVYRAASRLIRQMRQAAEPEASLEELLPAVEGLMQALRESPQVPIEGELLRDLLGMMDALRRQKEDPASYLLLNEGDAGHPALNLLCLNIRPYLAEATRRFCGFVCYSATLSPLPHMRELLGGDSEDACFELPSPFPRENLLCLQLPINTRYRAREQSLPQLAEAIRAMYLAKEGKYIAFFPSYRYLMRAAELLIDLPLHIQQSGMDEAARLDYLAHFTQDDEPLLGLCVLGGVFAEGVDLPGLALIGVCVVGLGLPQLNPRSEAIRHHGDALSGSGFDIAYRVPGMHKVLQAAGRLIRSEQDRGVLMLLDDRFGEAVNRALLPGHLQPRALKKADEVRPLLQEFWHG